MNRQWKVGIVVALATLASGFGFLCLYWFTGDSNPNLPDLFDYRSATVGDGLVLPVLLGSLAGSSYSKRLVASSRRLRISLLAAGVGLVAGIATVWAWHRDPSPRLNWTWPEPHQFNSAGWTHAVFLCLASAAAAGLLAFVLLSLRSERRRRPGTPIVSLVSGSAVALVGLILIDNAEANGTNAATATWIAVALGAALAIAACLWAAGRPILPGLAVGTVGGLGIVAFCNDWPPSHMALLGPTWAAVLLLAFALSQPLGHEQKRKENKGREPPVVDSLAGANAHWAVMIGCALAAGGAAAIVVGRIVEGDLVGTLILLGVGVLLVAALPVYVGWPRQGKKEDRTTKQGELLWDFVGTSGVTLYVLGALALAGWIGLTGLAGRQVQGVLNGAEFLFDIFVFTLFRERFKQLREEEAEAVGQARPPLTRTEYLEEVKDLEGGPTPPGKPAALSPEAAYGAVPDLYITLYSFAGSVLVTLIILLSFAAGVLGINAVASGQDPDGTTLWVAAAAAGLIALFSFGAQLVAARDQESRLVKGLEEPALDVSNGAFAAALVAAAAAGVLPLVAGGHHSLWLLGGIAALVYAFLAAESLVFSPARLQLQKISPKGWVLIVATALAVFSAAFWLFSVGIWSDGRPAEVWRIGVLVPLFLAGTLALGAGVGGALAKSGTGETFTPSDPAGNSLLDQLLYALFMVPLAVVPITTAAHLSHEPGAGLAVVSSLAFVPGLFGAFLWVIDNNASHHRWQQKLRNPNLPMWQRASGNAGTAGELLNRYKARMLLHSRLQNWGATGALVFATGFLTASLFGA